MNDYDNNIESSIDDKAENDKIRKNKSRFWSGFIIGIILTLLTLTAIYRIKYGNLPFVEQEISDLDYNKINNKMKKIQRIVSQLFLFDEDTSKVEDGIYAGMMSGLDDPYSTYYDATSYQSLTEESEGKYAGIGALVTQNQETGVMSIVEVFDDSPAKEAGMQDGDIIYKVGDIEVTGMDLDVIVSTYIKGDEGTSVDIIVLRGDDMKEVELHITRRIIDTPSVEYKMIDDVGYIEVTQFIGTTTEHFKEAIDDITSQNAKGIIIDLRNNPGGLLDVAIDMADYILPDDLITYTEDKKGNRVEYKGSDEHEVDIPIVILINGNSASSSEVLTGALKDYDVATIVGTKSFGKGIVQNLIPLGDGTAIKVTVEKYFTPSGVNIHGEGITPDVEVEADEGAIKGEDSDNQLNEALKLFE